MPSYPAYSLRALIQYFLKQIRPYISRAGRWQSRERNQRLKKPRPDWPRLFLCSMTFNNYPNSEQDRLTKAIRADASQHQATPLYLWRTALEQVNPQVVTVEPYCMTSAFVAIYDLLDIATNA